MTLFDIKYHIEEFGCTMDPLGDDRYLASNCISGGNCEIENLEEYSVVTLCHYFFQLGVSPPAELRSAFEAYSSMREVIDRLKTQDE